MLNSWRAFAMYGKRTRKFSILLAFFARGNRDQCCNWRNHNYKHGSNIIKLTMLVRVKCNNNKYAREHYKNHNKKACVRHLSWFTLLHDSLTKRYKLHTTQSNGIYLMSDFNMTPLNRYIYMYLLRIRRKQIEQIT